MTGDERATTTSATCWPPTAQAGLSADLHFGWLSVRRGRDEQARQRVLHWFDRHRGERGAGPRRAGT